MGSAVKEETVRFCAFRNREVINVCNCRRLGCVIDVLINTCTGCIEAIILPGPGKVCGFLGYDSEYVIPYKCITKMGEDIIFVEIQEEKCLKSCK